MFGGVPWDCSPVVIMGPIAIAWAVSGPAVFTPRVSLVLEPAVRTCG